MACPCGLSNRRGRHALLQNVHSSHLGASDGARESPGRRHRCAPEVGVSGDIQASALQARSASPGSAPAPMMPVPRRTGWCLHGLQAVGRAKARSRNAPTTKRFCVLRLPPGFPAVPQYLSHTPVAPQTLTEPEEWLAHIQLFVQPFSVAKGFRLTRMRTWGQPTCRRACWNAAQVYDLRWLRRLSHLKSARRVRCTNRVIISLTPVRMLADRVRSP